MLLGLLAYSFSLLAIPALSAITISDSILAIDVTLDRSKRTLALYPWWQGWPSGESTCLSPMWPGFDFRTRRQMWTEFVGSLLCYERFFPGYSGFPLSPKTNI